MKKIMVLLLATSMLFASVACSNGNGAGDSGNGNGGSGGSVVTKDDYLGTWTGTMVSSQMSITLNADESCVAYIGGFAGEGSYWKSPIPGGVAVYISGGRSFSGKLENGKLVVDYMGQNISLTKVDTSAYEGTWIGTMGSAKMSITLVRNGTVYANNFEQHNRTGFWTVTNSGFIMCFKYGPEEEFFGQLQNDKLVVNYGEDVISLTKV